MRSISGTSRATWPAATALTGLSFSALHWAGLLGSLPLLELLGILALCVLASQVVRRRYGTRPERLWLVVGVDMLAVTVIIYAIGWGPTLALGYLFPLGELLRARGSREWPLAYAFSVIGIAGGQGAVALGLVSSYLPSPYVYALAVLAALGLAFVMHLLASVAAAREAAERDVRTSDKRHLDVLSRLAAIVESSDEAIIGMDLDGTVTSWNRAAEEMYGYSAAEVVGENTLLHAGNDPTVTEMMRMIAHGYSTGRLETVRRRKDGSEFDAAVTVSPVRDQFGQIVGASVIARDVTEQRRAARVLTDSEESFRQMFAANPQPMWVYETRTLRFLEVNEAAVRQYGYSRDEFLALRVTDIVTSAADPEGPAMFRHRLSDGRLIDVEVTSNRLTFAGRDAMLLGARDVTGQHALEQRLRHQAFHDELTGVANRALFRDRIDQALARARRTGSALAVVVVDLDHFHQINEVFGPDTGDRVLREVAFALGDLVRPTDTVARIGSDEFALLLADLEESVETAAAVADRVLERLAAPMSLEGNRISIEATIGAAVATDATLEVAELIQRAETALARAKQSLLRREIADPNQAYSSAQRVAVVAELRQAIEGGRLRLHYQPVFDLAAGRVSAVEALVRWEHPERGLVPPDEFVPLAERTGLIRPLTTFVLQQAITQLADWRAGSPELSLSVNLGTTNLTDPDLAREISRLLFKNGVPARALTLEITEGGVMSEPVRTAEVVEQLSTLGVALSVDDFGSGYSSLSKLRSLPISEIKLDKSFVVNISNDPSDATIVRSSIDLAHNLGLRVVAEGIETEEVAEELTALRCDMGQGYWLCRPMPASQMTSWLGRSVPFEGAASSPTGPTAPTALNARAGIGGFAGSPQAIGSAGRAGAGARRRP